MYLVSSVKKLCNLRRFKINQSINSGFLLAVNFVDVILFSQSAPSDKDLQLFKNYFCFVFLKQKPVRFLNRSCRSWGGHLGFGLGLHCHQALGWATRRVLIATALYSTVQLPGHIRGFVVKFQKFATENRKYKIIALKIITRRKLFGNYDSSI